VFCEVFGGQFGFREVFELILGSAKFFELILGSANPKRLKNTDVDYCSQHRMDSWKARRWRDELVLSLFFGIVSKFIYLLFTTELYTYPCVHDTFKQLAITLEKICILFYLSFPENWNQTFLFGKLKSTRYLWLLNNIQIIFNNA
jgi:hypothetical protein